MERCKLEFQDAATITILSTVLSPMVPWPSAREILDFSHTPWIAGFSIKRIFVGAWVLVSPAQGFADSRQVVPTVPYCVILKDELRGDRRPEAQ